ncbi:LysE family transporter [uncultured Shewanella sp.]|uniref:LysE family transporter n=1 Tax=uncultured Shewanella sp. TaxID=173975 RepID=UPI0026299B79|nr:LysE family transporter [uncultured Shewanella sp.]
MHDYFFLLPILLFLLLGVMSPGPSFIFVAKTAMAQSRQHAIAAAIGLSTGAALFAIIAALGLFVILNHIPWLFIGIKMLGGGYLCYLAYKMWQSRHEPMSHSNTTSSSTSLLKMFFLGLLTQLSNPKTAIIFASAFAAFLPNTLPDYSYSLITLSAFIIDCTWYILVAALLSTPSAQHTFQTFKHQICQAAGAMMGFMGIKLLTSHS